MAKIVLEEEGKHCLKVKQLKMNLRCLTVGSASGGHGTKSSYSTGVFVLQSGGCVDKS